MKMEAESILFTLHIACSSRGCFLCITHLSQSIEAGKQFVENLHQILGAVRRRNSREAHDVGVENTANEGRLL